MKDIPVEAQLRLEVNAENKRQWEKKQQTINWPMYEISVKKYRGYTKALASWEKEGIPEKQPKMAEWFAWVARLLKFQDE
jgi:hypothetical protein